MLQIILIGSFLCHNVSFQSLDNSYINDQINKHRLFWSYRHLWLWFLVIWFWLIYFCVLLTMNRDGARGQRGITERWLFSKYFFLFACYLQECSFYLLGYYLFFSVTWIVWFTLLEIEKTLLLYRCSIPVLYAFYCYSWILFFISLPLVQNSKMFSLF